MLTSLPDVFYKMKGIDVILGKYPKILISLETETQIQLTQSHTDDLNLVFNGFNIYFNNNKNKFISVFMVFMILS